MRLAVDSALSGLPAPGTAEERASARVHGRQQQPWEGCDRGLDVAGQPCRVRNAGSLPGNHT